MGAVPSCLGCSCLQLKLSRPVGKQVGKSTASSVSHAPVATSVAHPVHELTASSACEGYSILRSVLAIEQRCLGSQNGEHGAPTTEDIGALNELVVDCLLDEPERKYMLCSSPSSQTIIVYFKLLFPDVYADEVLRAVVDLKERTQRDADSEYQVHRRARDGDATMQEDLSHMMRAPWPFADREILQRRWQLPLEGFANGRAVVLRSFEDAALFPGKPDRVRAFAHLSANIIRPFSTDDGVPGLELVVCQQIDIGGLVPDWAQRFLSRFAVSQGLEWARKLREHCLVQRQLRSEDLKTAATLNGEGLSRSVSTRLDAPVETRRSPMETLDGNQVLQEILAIEGRCANAIIHEPGIGPWDDPFGIESSFLNDDQDVECLLDEPKVKYCLCCDLDSPIVVGYIRVILNDVFLNEVRSALLNREERLLRDPDSEYQVLREAREGDPTSEEDVSFVWRAPWPFWDRDVVQRRWVFPLSDEGGLAVVCRSFDDDTRYPEHAERVRAVVLKCGYLLRPLQYDPEVLGVEITVCQQVDLGGLCPSWAQEYITRWAVNHGLTWAAELRKHCNRHRTAAEPEGTEEDDETFVNGWW